MLTSCLLKCQSPETTKKAQHAGISAAGLFYHVQVFMLTAQFLSQEYQVSLVGISSVILASIRFQLMGDLKVIDILCEFTSILESG